MAIGLVIFAEGALLIGLFLPGDTLLIPAGIWASHHHNQLNVWLLLPTVIIAAIAGYQVGYIIGERAGPRVFKRSGGVLFRADYIPRTQDFINRHGGKSLVVGRFIAVARTLIPIMAGVGRMSKRQFMIYNIIGAIFWTSSLVLASYWIGQRVSNIDKYILPVVLIGVASTVIGEAWVILRTKEARRNLTQGLREEYRYFFKRDKEN